MSIFRGLGYAAHTNAGTSDIADSDSLSMEKQEAKRFGEDTKHRANLVYWMIVAVSVWLVGVLLIVVLNEICCINASDNVLLMLLGTTTINVLGLSKIILNGLFGNGKRRKIQKDKPKNS